MKRTWHPSKVKRKRKHGFRSRMSNKKRQKVLRNRRKKGRKTISLMRSKISSLSKSEDFKNILNGKKISNPYSIIFFKKLSSKSNKLLNVGLLQNEKLEMQSNEIKLKED